MSSTRLPFISSAMEGAGSLIDSSSSTHISSLNRLEIGLGPRAPRRIQILPPCPEDAPPSLDFELLRSYIRVYYDSRPEEHLTQSMTNISLAATHSALFGLLSAALATRAVSASHRLDQAITLIDEFERDIMHLTEQLRMQSIMDAEYDQSKPIGLIVVIRSFATATPLYDVVYDISRLHYMLTNGLRWSDPSLRIMSDCFVEATNVSTFPSKANILAQLDTFITKLAASKAGILTFGSYGGQQLCPPGKTDEEDGLDEYIMLPNGEILLDDELKAHIVDRVPAGSTLLVLFDTCHSGTLLDMPYKVNFERLMYTEAPRDRGPRDEHGLVVSISAADDWEQTGWKSFTQAISQELFKWAKAGARREFTLQHLVHAVQRRLDTQGRVPAPNQYGYITFDVDGQPTHSYEWNTTVQHVTVYSSYDPEEVDINLALQGLVPRGVRKRVTRAGSM